VFAWKFRSPLDGAAVRDKAFRKNSMTLHNHGHFSGCAHSILADRVTIKLERQ